MKMKNKMLTLVMVLAVVALCGLSINAASQNVVNLTMWTFLNPQGDSPRDLVLKEIVDGFNESHPNIRVTVQYVHWREIDNKAIQATAAGKGPDILNVYSVQLPKHIAAGTLIPLDNYVSQWWSHNGDDYIFAKDNLVKHNHIWSMYWETRVWLLWYRADYLKEERLQLPKTLDELVSIASQISSKNVIGYALGLSTTQLSAEFVETFEMVLRAAGGRFFDATGKTIVNNKAGIRAMQWVKDLFSKGASSSACVSMNADDVLSGIQAGTIAMTTEGSMRVSAARQGPDDNLETAPFPSFKPGVPAPALVAGQTLGIGANSKHPDEAWEFISYYLSRDSELLWATKAGVLPIRSSVLEDPYFTDSKAGQEIAQWVKVANEYGFTSQYPADFAYFSQLMTEAAQRVVLLNEPISKTLDALAQSYNVNH